MTVAANQQASWQFQKGISNFNVFYIAVAIDLIVQHIRDFLNNRTCHGSTGNMALYMNLDLGNSIGDGTASGVGKAMGFSKARPH